MDDIKRRRIKSIERIISVLMYISLGIYIVIAGEAAIDTLHLVIGGVIFLESLEEFVLEVVRKSYKTQKHSLYHPFAFMIIAVMILTSGEHSIGVVCIIWGVIAIIDSAKEMNEAIYEKARGLHLFKFLRSIVAIVFAILLIKDPFEHVLFHMYLLAAEYFLESLFMINKIVDRKGEEA